MHDDVHPTEGSPKSVRVSDVTYEVTQAQMIEAPDAHLMLLELVAAECNEPAWAVLIPNRLSELGAKGARSARD